MQIENPRSVCVVGAGPVGLSFALRVADLGVSVTLIDGGGSDVPPPGREFNRGPVVSAADADDRRDPMLVPDGTLYADPDYLANTRYRGTGGSSWHWGVRWRTDAEQTLRLVAGAPEDFTARPTFDVPGWSVPAGDVSRHYGDALAFFGVENQSFDISRYDDGLEPLPFASPALAPKVFHFGKANHIRHVAVEAVQAHPGIEVHTGLNLVGIRTSLGGARVDRLDFADTAGGTHSVTADQFVLALGGIENARQLLLAAEDGDLHDPHDVFGRWFMDHPHVRFGYLQPQIPLAECGWYDFQHINGTPVLRGHELTPAAASSESLLRFSLDLVGRPALDATRAGHALAVAHDAARARDVRTVGHCLPTLLGSPLKTAKLALQAKKGIHNTAVGGWSDPAARMHDVGVLAMEAMVEQRPSPDNRVRLGSERSRFGRRLPVLQWSWSQREIDSIHRSVDLVRGIVEDSGVGAFTSLEQLGQGPIPRAGSGAHHIGGTRQSDDPEGGVVDHRNRVHGVDNLTLVGSSVFPNSVGYANPTLTAVADGLRVANIVASDYGNSTPAELES